MQDNWGAILPAITGLIGVVIGAWLQDRAFRRRECRKASLRNRTELLRLSHWLPAAPLVTARDADDLIYQAHNALPLLLETGLSSRTVLSLYDLWTCCVWAQKEKASYQKIGHGGADLGRWDPKEQEYRDHRHIDIANHIDNPIYRYLDRYLFTGRYRLALVIAIHRNNRTMHLRYPELPKRPGAPAVP